MLKAHLRRSRLLLMAGLLATGCAQDPLLDPKPAPAVAIGWEKTPAEQVLAELIGGSLARAGSTVRVEPAGRGAAGVAAALDRAAITLAPAFTTDPDPDSADRGEQSSADARSPEKVCATVSRLQPQGIAVSDCAESVWRPASGPPRYALARYRTGALTEPQLRRVNLVLGTITPAELAGLADKTGGGQPVAVVARGWLDRNEI